jgi:pilus assembly protein Flp/PilA
MFRGAGATPDASNAIDWRDFVHGWGLLFAASNGSDRSGPMFRFLCSLLRDKNGATAIEYGLIAALISVAIITAVTAVGTNLTTTFSNVANAL